MNYRDTGLIDDLYPLVSRINLDTIAKRELARDHIQLIEQAHLIKKSVKYAQEVAEREPTETHLADLARLKEVHLNLKRKLTAIY